MLFFIISKGYISTHVSLHAYLNRGLLDKNRIQYEAIIMT